jgi:hypothetical protein
MFPLAVLPAQYAGTLEVFETSRIDARSNQPFTIAPNPPPREVIIAADASFIPTVRLRANDRRWDYMLSYSPTFSVTDVELTPYAQPVVLNAGAASIGWHNRSVRLVLSEFGSYGVENLAYLYATPVAGQTTTAGQTQTMGQMGQTTTPGMGQTAGQALGQSGASPTIPLQTFPFGSSSTTASMQLRASERVTLSVSGGYSLSGNLANSAEANTVYPEQFGPTAAASVGYALSPSDSLVTIASAQQTTTPEGVCTSGAPGQLCREVTPSVTVAESIRHRLSSTTTISANLGVAASIYQLSSGRAWGILPIGGVAFVEAFSPPPKDPFGQLEASSLRLSADVASTVNVFTGSPSNRLQLTASLTNHVAPDVVVAVVAGALETVPLPQPDPSPLTVVNGGVEVRMRLTRAISLSAGLQAFWEKQENVGTLPVATTTATTGATTSASEVGYVSLTVRMPRLRL